ncbi:hypothetical protein B0H10DRAFT_506584 [Mycena sp. CBHHK59/15]|nr:hypothetical protein B0H10DRAFT_506584 [Mycena sp. CBHHK59/15]
MNQSTEPATSCSHKLDSNRGVIAVAVERAQHLESWLDDNSLVAFIELWRRIRGQPKHTRSSSGRLSESSGYGESWR